jgi:carbon storage regulator
MLVLTRKQGERIRIGDDITITVVRTKGKAVRLGIQAPAHVPVLRGEIAAAIERQTQQTQQNAATPGDGLGDDETGVPPPTEMRELALAAHGPLYELMATHAK